MVGRRATFTGSPIGAVNERCHSPADIDWRRTKVGACFESALRLLLERRRIFGSLSSPQKLRTGAWEDREKREAAICSLIYVSILPGIFRSVGSELALSRATLAARNGDRDRRTPGS